MRCDLSLGGCVWRELKLYKYWAAVRASVTEEDAVRGVLKGTDAAAHPHSYNRQNSKINDIFSFANHLRRYLVNDACDFGNFYLHFTFIWLWKICIKRILIEIEKNINKNIVSPYSSTIPIRILPSTGNTRANHYMFEKKTVPTHLRHRWLFKIHMQSLRNTWSVMKSLWSLRSHLAGQVSCETRQISIYRHQCLNLVLKVFGS